MEHIISFLPNQFSSPELFHVELTGISYPDPEYHIRRAHSSIYCLEYVIGGTGCINVDGEPFHPHAGDVYLLPKGHEHDYWSDPADPLHKIWINAKGRLCDSLMEVYHLEKVRLIAACGLYYYFQSFLSLCERADLTPEERASRCALLFHTILDGIYRHISVDSQLPAPVPAAAAKQYLDRHINDRLSMKELSGHVNLSVSQLTRQFRSAFGQTPYDYFLDQKIETAQLLLSGTLLPIKEIAYRLSFADEHYFSNIFKQKLGTTPGQWRKNQR